MLRSTLLSSLVCVVLCCSSAASAQVAPPTCTRSAHPPRVTATLVADAGPGGRAQLVACVRPTGRRVVLRRGSTASSAGPRVLGTPAVDGWKVVWSEGDRAGARQRQGSVDLRRRPVVTHVRTLVAHVDVRLFESDELPTVALPGHVLAWIELDSPADGSLVVRREGRPPVVLATHHVASLRVEDGRTLVWSDEFGVGTYRDFATLPRQGGCPVRSAFGHVVTETAQVRVTASASGDYRACWRATGRDAIVLHLVSDLEAASFSVAGEHLLVDEVSGDKYQPCEPGSFRAIEVFDVRRQAVEVPSTGLGPECVDAGPIVLSPTGAPAWIQTTGATAALRTLRPDRTIADLDSGPAGSLAALTATADGFTWTHDGEPRSVTAP